MFQVRRDDAARLVPDDAARRARRQRGRARAGAAPRRRRAPRHRARVLARRSLRRVAPFACAPGYADLTADVDFTELALLGRARHALEPAFFGHQAALETVARARPRRRRRRRARARRALPAARPYVLSDEHPGDCVATGELGAAASDARRARCAGEHITRGMGYFYDEASRAAAGRARAPARAPGRRAPAPRTRAWRLFL